MTDIQATADRLASKILARHAIELDLACWDMLSKGQLFSQGWRLAVKVDPKTFVQTTQPIPPKDPVPQGFDRVLSQQIPTRT